MHITILLVSRGLMSFAVTILLSTSRLPCVEHKTQRESVQSLTMIPSALTVSNQWSGQLAVWLVDGDFQKRISLSLRFSPGEEA